MILGTNGKPLKKLKYAKAVVYESQDLEQWNPVKPYNVPEWARSDAAMEYMLDGGEIICMDEQAPYYKAERLPEVLQ